MKETISLGDGVILRPASIADIRTVTRLMRPLDRKECEIANDLDPRPNDFKEGVWAILHNGSHVGFGGFVGICGESVLSHRRGFFFLSTTYVNSIKVLFVKKSRLVFQTLANMMPSYVDTVLVAPLKEYTSSIRWLKKVLGFQEEYDREWNSEVFTILKKRKGA